MNNIRAVSVPNSTEPYVLVIRDNKHFIIATDTSKYVTIESKTYLTDNIDFATRFDSDDIGEFLSNHINEIIK